MESFPGGNPYLTLPGISPEEWAAIQQAIAHLSEDQQKYFYMLYTTKRRAARDMLIFCAVGFLVPGIQRFLVGQIGLGILYLFTMGLFFIGTIVDLANYRSLALEYNRKMVYESFELAKMNH